MPWYGSTGTDLVRTSTPAPGPLERGADHVGSVSRLLLVAGPSTTGQVGLVVAVVRAGHRLPPGAGDAPGRAVGRGLRVTALALAAVGAHLTVRALLDRSRSRRWAEEWAAVEPVWSGAGS